MLTPRLPFYTLCKTAVFAYFASGRGIGYVYHTLLEPLFREHEPQIDAFIANLKARAGEGARGSVGWVWDTGRKAMGVSAPRQRRALLSRHEARQCVLSRCADETGRVVVADTSSRSSRHRASRPPRARSHRRSPIPRPAPHSRRTASSPLSLAGKLCHLLC